jgi:hypothetical protein
MQRVVSLGVPERNYSQLRAGAACPQYLWITLLIDSGQIPEKPTPATLGRAVYFLL